MGKRLLRTSPKGDFVFCSRDFQDLFIRMSRAIAPFNQRGAKQMMYAADRRNYCAVRCRRFNQSAITVTFNPDGAYESRQHIPYICYLPLVDVFYMPLARGWYTGYLVLYKDTLVKMDNYNDFLTLMRQLPYLKYEDKRQVRFPEFFAMYAQHLHGVKFNNPLQKEENHGK